MKNILIVKWCDAYEMIKEEVVLSEMYDHDDIVRISLHIETEILQIDQKLKVELINGKHDIMIYITVRH